jgi:hypothetical protein
MSSSPDPFVSIGCVQPAPKSSTQASRRDINTIVEAFVTEGKRAQAMRRRR